MESPKRYHPALVTLHWLMALLIFVNLYLGMVTFEDRGRGPADFGAGSPFVTIHMAVGVTLIILLIVRFILRMRTKRPAEATAGNKYLDLLAKIVHYGLYLAVLAVIVLGLVFSLQTGRFQSAFLGAESQFSPPTGDFSPPAAVGGGVPDFPGGRGGPGGGFGMMLFHELTAYSLLSLVALHILAALYHQFIRKDHLIRRMWYGQR